MNNRDHTRIAERPYERYYASDLRKIYDESRSSGSGRYIRNARDWASENPRLATGLIALGAFAIGAAVWLLNRNRNEETTHLESDYAYSDPRYIDTVEPADITGFIDVIEMEQRH